MVASNKYSSPTISHIKAYSVISEISKYVFGFELVKYIYAQVTLLTNQVVDVISKYPVVIDNVSYADKTFDAYILTPFDTYILNNIIYIAGLPSVYYSYVLKTYNSYGETFNKFYLGKINYYLGINNSYSFNSEESKVYQFLTISNYGLTNFKSIVLTNSNKLSNYLIGLINGQLDANKDGNIVTKYYNIGYNVATQIYGDLNQNYLTPIKIQTTDYVSDVANQTKSKADSYVKNLNFLNKVEPTTTTVEVPVVSASA